MKNEPRAIKLQFSKKVRSDFIRMSDKILEFVKQRTPKSQILGAFCVHDYEDKPADIFKVYFLDGSAHMEHIHDFGWNDLEENIPGLREFCEKYSLGKSFSIAAGHDVPPHRHYYTLDSMWSISMFRGDSPGTIQFYHKTGDDDVEEVASTKGNYRGWVSESKTATQPGDFYSLRTWSWHAWQADDPKLNSYCAIFYMKNTTTEKSVLEAIKHIEKY